MENEIINNIKHKMLATTVDSFSITNTGPQKSSNFTLENCNSKDNNNQTHTNEDGGGILF